MTHVAAGVSLRLAVAIAAVVGCGAAVAQASPPKDEFKTSVSIGLDRSTGKFGASQKTDITYIPVTLKLENSDVVLKLSVPHISITGPSNVIGGGGTAIVTQGTASNSARRSASGLGDVVASAAFNVGRNPAGYGLDFVTKVKFPTADEKQGLGTGERDYFAQFDAYSLVGKATYFGTLGMKKMGDTPTINFRDTTYGAAGVGFALNKKTQMGLIYDHRQSSVVGVDSQKELTLFVSRQIDKDLRFQAYVVGGLTNSSVDNAVGLQLSQALE
jgi:hypothetical protein